MTFEQAFQLLIGFEGGYTMPDPSVDPGGETKFGISKRAYPHLDIKALTLEDAKAIYLQDYWNKCLCPQLPDPLRFQVFDCAVNSGPHQAIILLQRSVKVEDDGVIGPKTLAALAGISSAAELSIRFLAARLRFMTGLANWPPNSKGWSRRIADNMEEVFK